VIIEDSKVGATGALASGASVIGLAAGRHCFDGHADMLRSVGVKDVAHGFDEVAQLLGFDQTSR
jgi:beta-phosphoglucomutase-like phosphatase (HAD superfamily)